MPTPFSLDYLFTSPTDNPPAIFGVLTAGFVVLFLASLLVYWRRAKIAPDNPALRRLIRRVSKAGMWCGGIGIFLAAMRYAQVLYLSMPIWMYLLILGMIITVGYFVYEVSERYPLAVWQLQESQIERRYRPVARRRPEPQRPRQRPTNVRGKQKKR